jgi:hypothetical protein
MVLAKLMGGLGNQMFQIAAAHALALRNGDESKFDLGQCYTPAQGNKASKYRTNIFKKISDVGISVNYMNKLMYDDLDKIYKEVGFSYNEIPYTKDMFLIGYFQSEKYFLDFKGEIIDLFEIPNKELVNGFLEPLLAIGKPITSVHIRRGDYLKHPDFHPVCSIEYYKKAMNEVGDSTFIFQSDDMLWVTENFKGANIIYSPFNDEISDLTLMTMVHNNIIANSSFSWWGAYLNQNKEKKVIAPSQWFGPMGPKDTQDLIPKDWVVI